MRTCRGSVRGRGRAAPTKTIFASASCWLLLVGLGVLLGACHEKTRTTADAAAVPSAAVSSASAAVASAPLPGPTEPPKDLDLKQLRTRLGCASGDRKKACAVVTEFADAGRFTGKSPAGESRWFGRAYRVEHRKETAEYLVLVARVAPTAQVCNGCLPLMISTSPLPIERWREGKSLFSKLSGSRHRANRKNLAMRFVDAYQPKDEWGAIGTQGASVQLVVGVGEDVAYLRQPSLKRLLLVRPARSLEAEAGDGLYAELWQTSW